MYPAIPRYRVFIAGFLVYSAFVGPSLSWAADAQTDPKKSREVLIGTTRVVLLQVSRITDFTDPTDGKPPRAVTSVQIVYLLENLGEKSSGVYVGADVFAAGTTEPALRHTNNRACYYKGENYNVFRKRQVESRLERAVARLPKVKDATKAEVETVTFDDVEVTTRKVDIRLRAGFRKGEKDQHVLFRNVPLE